MKPCRPSATTPTLTSVLSKIGRANITESAEPQNASRDPRTRSKARAFGPELGEQHWNSADGQKTQTWVNSFRWSIQAAINTGDRGFRRSRTDDVATVDLHRPDWLGKSVALEADARPTPAP
jgi:hypothetical protein